MFALTSFRPSFSQGLSSIFILLLTRRILQSIIYRFKTTRLHGPTAASKIFGISQTVAKSRDPGALYESWVTEYGAAFRVNGPFNTERIVLCDPRAISHVCNLDAGRYSQTPTNARLLSNICGDNNVICLQGDDHKRTRKILNPVFGPTAMKHYVPVLLDAAYKVKTAWDGLLQNANSDEIVINVGEWMEKVALDVIGIAAFSHDFGSLRGETSQVMECLQALSRSPPSPVAMIIMLLSQAFPSLLRLPLPRNHLIAKLSDSTTLLARELLKKARDQGEEEKSALGVLAKSGEVSLSEKDIIVQMKTVLIAGNETTAVSLKWALIELSKHQEKQNALRDEITSIPNSDPDPEELINGFPYLDAVVKEVTRLHPFGEVLRTAAQDDVIPLSSPVKTANGLMTSSISVAKSATIVVPVHCVNRSEALWGKTAKEFSPERWLTDDGIPNGAKQFAGYHHSLTFFDGPRTCLGKYIAISELKAVLFVLIRSYKFVPRDGAKTEYAMERRIVPHPVIAGEGNRLPIRVIRLEGN